MRVETKLIEIRDRATFIPAIAILVEADQSERAFLLRRAGFGPYPYILLGRLDGGLLHYDPYLWGGRTMPVIHKHLLDNWDSIESGSVLDVEFILDEVSQPKVSERLEGELYR